MSERTKNANPWSDPDSPEAAVAAYLKTLATTGGDGGSEAAELAFIATGATYARTRGISWLALVEYGVAPAVLAAASIQPTSHLAAASTEHIIDLTIEGNPLTPLVRYGRFAGDR